MTKAAPPPGGSPWRDPETVTSALSEITTLQARLLSELTTALQEIHGEGDERFWRIMVMPWLLAWVPFVADCTARCGERGSGGLTRKVPRADRFRPGAAGRPVPADSLHSVQLTKSLRFAEATRLLLQNEDVERIGSIRAEVYEPFTTGGLKSLRVVAAGIEALRALKGDRVILYRASYMSRRGELAVMKATKGAFLPLAAPVFDASRVEVDAQSRSRLEAIDFGDSPLARSLSLLLPCDLPMSHFEGFAALGRFVRDRYPRAPRAILSANAWYFDEAFKLWAVRAATNGTRLLGVQHGGGSGVNGQLPADEHEMTISDRYYSWGWTRSDTRARVVPMPSPKLLGIDAMPADNGLSGVLFVATVMPKHLPSLPYTDAWFEDYLEWQRRFAVALDPSVRTHLRVRPHREDDGWGVADRWRAAAPEASIESWERLFYDSLRDARIFVVDHISTTWGEALGLGKPTVLFWDPKSYSIRPEAAPILDGLRRSGVLCDTPEHAAETLHRVYADVENWWDDPERQASVNAFREHFARTDSRGVEVWARELEAVLSDA